MTSLCRMILLILATVLLPLSATATEIVPRGKLPEGVTPLRYKLELEVFPAEDTFKGEVSIDVTLDRATRLIWLHGRGQKAINAHVLTGDGGRIDASFSEIDTTGVAKFETKTPIGPGRVTLVIRYSANFDQSLQGLYRVVDGDKAYAYTQFQPLRARRAFPGFDEPRFKTPFDISLTMRSKHVAVSNAPILDSVESGNGQKKVTFAATPPLPTYLIALAVGDFDVVEWDPIPPNNIRDRPIPLRGIALRGKGHEFTYALTHTAALLEILENYFGRSYPFAKLDLIAPAAFRSGGMENAGAIFYRPDRILMGETPSIWQRRGFASIHVHELAHSWFGNLVTPAWWDDLWLNEAFATWITASTLHAWRPEEFAKHRSVRTTQWALRSDRLGSARQIRQPVENDGDVSHAFDSITYSKGASLLSMTESYLGKEAFRDGVRRFIDNHAFGVATADDFVAALSESAQDPEVPAAFRSFLEQSGAPLVEANWSCNAKGATDVELRQSRSLPLGAGGESARRWSIPICVAYRDDGGRGKICTVMGDEKMTLRLPSNSCPTWVLPNAEGAAYVNFALPEKGWTALIDEMQDLPPGEALSVIGSLWASYEAGLAGTETFLAAAQEAAQSDHWDVVQAPVQLLRNIKNFYVPRSLRPQAVERLREIYRPALERFDLSDAALAGEAKSGNQALLRADLVWFMALDLNEPDLRARLTRLARKYIGFGENTPADRSVLHPNLVRVALMTGAGEEGMLFIERLIEILRETPDDTLRGHVIRALGFQTDRAVLERIWRHILDPDTPEWIASSLLHRQGQRVDNQQALFEWITNRYGALEDRFPPSQMRWLPWRSSAFCSKDGRDKVADFYGARSKNYQGGERALRNVLEYIEICSAIVQVQRDDAVAAITAKN